MKTTLTPLEGCVVVEAPVHADERGFFTEVFHASKFQPLGLPTEFAQDNHSRSIGGVLRGLHIQGKNPQGKLVRVVQGRIFDVAVDLRRDSDSYGKWFGLTLEEGDGKQLWIPPGFAHGFLVLSDVADVSYKCTTLYDAASDLTLRWDDETINVKWPLPAGGHPSLSAKDARGLALSDVMEKLQ